jgi:thiol-disulfide isomerase/thioredoxin
VITQIARLLIASAFLGTSAVAIAAPAVGDVPPPRVGFDLSGEPVLLTSFSGKAIVVSFWATWCAYCLKELPILHNIQRAAGKDSMQVIAVNTESREVFRKAARTLKELDVLHAHDNSHQAQDKYGVKGIPHLVIVGRDGRVVAVYTGYSESSLDGIVADINRALAAPKPPSEGESAVVRGTAAALGGKINDARMEERSRK